MRHCVFVLLLALAGTALRAQAQDSTPKLPRLSGPVFESAPDAPHLSLMRQASGEPILVVRYPWRQHKDVSVEIRLLEEKDSDVTVWTPVFFFGNYLNNDSIQAIHRCQDLGANLPATATFTSYADQQRVDFEVIGKRNALDRSAVAIRCDSRLEGPRRGTRVIFWPLEEWSVDKNMLWLELPKNDFSKQCRIRVWFLRHDNIVWAETFAWPGYPGPSNGK